MVPSILSIGNATNDSYLEINPDQKVFKDEENTFHYDLTFDDSTLEYKKAAKVYGGVVLSDQVFRAAHLKSFSSINPQGFANFSPEKSHFETIDRYIISTKASSVVLSGNPRNLKWERPIYTPSVIYIAEPSFSEQYLSDFEKYLDENPKIEIIFSLNDFDDRFTRKLLQRSKIVFVNLDKAISLENIDFYDIEKATDDIIELGAEQVVVIKESEIIAANKNVVSKINYDFNLNSFYQSSIFKASYVAESFESTDIEHNLQLSVVIASESDFSEIIKPLIASQILSRSSQDYEVEFIKNIPNFEEKLHSVAEALVVRPKGIFAADESGGNINKKFESIGIEDIEENRRRYREMFFTTPDIQNYLSGIILFEETVSQSTPDGENFVDYLKNKGILAGVKLDGGLAPLTGFEGETITKGLDVLDEKLEKYAAKGLDFAKWRVAFDIDAEREDTDDQEILPTNAAIAANVQILARYAKACQSYGIVPIVEPEVIFAGEHSVEECNYATKRILHALFEELKLFKVDLKGAILKVNMVLSGKQNSHQSSPSEVAQQTIEVLKSTVPKELAGIVFLSGGQTVHQATDNLQAITNLGPFDWNITYSYARALQEPALKAWAGKDENTRQAQLVFLERVAANSHALYKN